MYFTVVFNGVLEKGVANWKHSEERYKREGLFWLKKKKRVIKRHYGSNYVLLILKLWCTFSKTK